MPFTLFRRRKADRSQAPAEAAAPQPTEAPSEPPAAPEAATTDTLTKPKRRRGARGGRTRKKPAVAGAKPEAKERPEPVRSQAEERRLQQRKERALRI